VVQDFDDEVSSVTFFRRKALQIAVILALGATVWAQDSDACASRRVIVNVRDRQGRFVMGLQPGSFQATLRGKPISVLSVSRRVTSPRVVLLLDHSGSVNRSNHEWEASRFVAGHVVASASTALRIALVIFSDRILDTVDFDHSSSDAMPKLLNLGDGKGPTALYDSVMYATGLLEPAQLGDAIYIVSDGGDNHSKARAREVEQGLTSRRIRLFWADLPLAMFHSEEEELGQEELQGLAEATGGAMVTTQGVSSPAGRESFGARANVVYDMMRSFYELEAGVPAGIERNATWELKVVDDHGKKLKDVEVFYPRRLPSCVASQHQN